MDFFLSFWMEGPVGHTWVSFIFDNAPPVSISIEARPTVGRSFDPLQSMFKQFELIYLIGDEHDLVGLRTNHRDEQMFLYHVQASPEAARRLFNVMPLMAETARKGFRIVPAIATMSKKISTCISPE